MTTPYQRTRALVQTKDFLRALTDPKASPRVPRAVRNQAGILLKYFPQLTEIQRAHEALPEVFGPAPPFSRLRGSLQTDNVVAATTQQQ